MQIRIKPEQVVPLLKRLNLAIGPVNESNKEDTLVIEFEKIRSMLQGMKAKFPRVKHWEETLVDQFHALRQHIYDDVLRDRGKADEIKKKLGLIADEIEHITNIISKIELPSDVETRLKEEEESSSKQQSQSVEVQARKKSKEWLQLSIPEKVIADPAMANLRHTYDHLENLQLKLCLLCFSIFPDNSAVKKRPLIYWWIGEGLIAKTRNKTAEEVGEDIFQKLIKQGLITPHNDNLSRSPLVNSCTMRPWTRHMLIAVAKEADFFDFEPTGTLSHDFSISHRACLVSRNSYTKKSTEKKNVSDKGSQNQSRLPVSGNQSSSSDNGSKEENLSTVFNVNEPYPSFDRDWLLKLKRAVVLQLGRWQASATHHIEVESLNGLGAQKHLKYLSLRGISRINELPPSIVELSSLEILDLRACHNLEKLPSDIGSLRKLTHLDVSECYLLDSMPKGLEKLSSLQVLKGFVIGDSKKTPCKIGDLAQLRNLRKLSINIGSEAVIREGKFEKLKEFAALCILTISWGVVSLAQKQEDAMKSLSFPPQLKKLDLRCIPQEMSPEWLKPCNLTNLEKLYIRGGILNSLDQGEANEWKVKILRLKYLKNLKIELSEVQAKFPHLIYLEKIKCHEIASDIFDEDIVWNKDEDDEAGKTE